MPSYQGVNSILVAQSKFAKALLAGGRRPMYLYSKQFVDAANKAGDEAARRATATSRSVFTSKLSGRPTAPPRRGRPTTEGQFAQFIDWRFDKANDAIALDLNYLDTAAPYWGIIEVGTGHTAQIANSERGPFAIGAPRQVGRRISSNLVWAAGSGGAASRAARGNPHEQLFLRTDVIATHLLAKGGNKLPRRIRIGQEITPKHYLRDGAQSGWRFYRREVERAFRRAYS
jgi:hypothetical protein